MDIGAENYATLDSGNLMSSERGGACFGLRGEKMRAVVHRLPGTIHFCRERLETVNKQ